MNLKSKTAPAVVMDLGSTVGELSSTAVVLPGHGCGEKGVRKSLTALGSLVRPSPAGCCRFTTYLTGDARLALSARASRLSTYNNLPSSLRAARVAPAPRAKLRFKESWTRVTRQAGCCPPDVHIIFSVVAAHGSLKL